MQPLCYARHQFPPEIIRRAVWLYLRFTLRYRDFEKLPAERNLNVSYETIRRCVLKFGPIYAYNLSQLRPRPSGTWHLNEMVVSAQGSGSSDNFAQHLGIDIGSVAPISIYEAPTILARCMNWPAPPTFSHPPIAVRRTGAWSWAPASSPRKANVVLFAR